MANATLLKLLKGLVKTGTKGGNNAINVSKGALELGGGALNKADDLLLKALKKAFNPVTSSKRGKRLGRDKDVQEFLEMLRKMNTPNVRKGAMVGGTLLAIKPSDNEYAEDAEIY